jgi:hypothetical protein
MAKKRYHQSKEDRRHEHEGMVRYEDHERMARRHESEGMKRRMDNSDPVPNTVSGLMKRESYAGYKESRRMMARDGAMIREDMSAPALLPQRVIDEYWPKAANYNMGYVDDLFYGAQKQMHEDYDDLRREAKAGKY